MNYNINLLAEVLIAKGYHNTFRERIFLFLFRTKQVSGTNTLLKFFNALDERYEPFKISNSVIKYYEYEFRNNMLIL